MLFSGERRSFLKSLSVLGGTLLLARTSLSASSQFPVAYFDTDFYSFGYGDFFKKYLKSCRSANKESLIKGLKIPMQFKELFQSDFLYKAENISKRKIRSQSENYSLFWIEGELGGQILFRGFASYPQSVRNYCILLHGMASTPERCFSIDMDYMGGIGHKLSEAGFAVWCPFIPQCGNFPSMIEAALILSSNGLSHHSVLCSLATCYNDIFSHLGFDSSRGHVVFGASIGALIALHTSLIDDSICGMVVSGYLRDDRLLNKETSHHEMAYSGNFFPENLNPAFMDYTMPSIFRKIPKIPICFEVGKNDNLSSVKLGRNRAYNAALKAFGARANLIELEVHFGGHEVVGGPVIDWLTKRTAYIN